MQDEMMLQVHSCAALVRRAPLSLMLSSASFHNTCPYRFIRRATYVGASHFSMGPSMLERLLDNPPFLLFVLLNVIIRTDVPL